MINIRIPVGLGKLPLGGIMRALWWASILVAGGVVFGNPLKSRCMKEGWVKVVSVGPALHLQASGLCEHPSGRVFFRQAPDSPVADALWFDPENLTYYLREGLRRVVLDPQVRQSMTEFLGLDGSLCSLFWSVTPLALSTSLIWQDWEIPAAMSADSRIVITESGRVLWVPEFNGNLATPIFWSNLGWITLRYCTWTQAAEHCLLNVVPFSTAHSVLAASHLKQGELFLPAAAYDELMQGGQLIMAPRLASPSRLKGCTSVQPTLQLQSPLEQVSSF